MVARESPATTLHNYTFFPSLPTAAAGKLSQPPHARLNNNNKLKMLSCAVCCLEIRHGTTETTFIHTASKQLSVEKESLAVSNKADNQSETEHPTWACRQKPVY